MSSTFQQKTVTAKMEMKPKDGNTGSGILQMQRERKFPVQNTKMGDMECH